MEHLETENAYPRQEIENIKKMLGMNTELVENHDFHEFDGKPWTLINNQNIPQGDYSSWGKGVRGATSELSGRWKVD